MFLALACSPASDAPTSAQIAPDELSERLAAGDAPLILDVRSAEEFEGGHIPGAVNIPHTELAARLDELGVSRDAEIVVHCESGRRAAAAEAVLADAGFTQVRDLDGHMKGWRASGYSAE
jgi:rhodanese-related sulfurtransferase